MHGVPSPSFLRPRFCLPCIVGLLYEVHIPSFEVEVLPLFCITVVGGVFGVLHFGSCRGCEQVGYVAGARGADDVAFDVCVPGGRVGVPGMLKDYSE